MWWSSRGLEAASRCLTIRVALVLAAATAGCGRISYAPSDSGLALEDTALDVGPADAAIDAGACGMCAAGRICGEVADSGGGMGCIPDPRSIIDIPGGTFTMGDGFFGDNPGHPVTLSAYRIDRFEVTAGRYQECVRGGLCGAVAGSGTGECNLMQGRLNAPMNCLPWRYASDFCAWAGGRLPSEAEWEFAARGTDGRAFPWGDEPVDCTRAEYWDCQDATWQMVAYPLPIGSVPAGASAFGVEDMAGNAWEWVGDYYSPTSYAECTGSCTDPRGPATGTERGSRGGGYFASDARMPVIYPLFVLRSAARDGANPDGGYVDIGFRCAYPP